MQQFQSCAIFLLFCMSCDMPQNSVCTRISFINYSKQYSNGIILPITLATHSLLHISRQYSARKLTPVPLQTKRFIWYSRKTTTKACCCVLAGLLAQKVSKKLVPYAPTVDLDTQGHCSSTPRK